MQLMIYLQITSGTGSGILPLRSTILFSSEFNNFTRVISFLTSASSLQYVQQILTLFCREACKPSYYLKRPKSKPFVVFNTLQILNSEAQLCRGSSLSCQLVLEGILSTLLLLIFTMHETKNDMLIVTAFFFNHYPVRFYLIQR